MSLEAVPLAGVTYGSVESTTGILAIYRMEDKHLWA
jgi:hypothetical protein